MDRLQFLQIDPPLCMPQIISPLQIDPKIRAIAEHMAKPDRHIHCHRMLLGKDAVQHLPRNAERICESSLGQSKRRKIYVPNDRTGMYRRAVRVP